MTEAELQEDQINAVVVGRGVHMDMGKRIEGLGHLEDLQEAPAPANPEPRKVPSRERTAKQMPVIEEIAPEQPKPSPVFEQAAPTTSPSGMGLMGEGSHKTKKQLSKKTMIYGGVGLLALALVVASNFLPKDTSSAQRNSAQAVGAEESASKPEDHRPFVAELTPEEVEILKAARQKKAEAESAAAMPSGGPLPANLAGVPAAAELIQQSMPAPAAAQTPAVTAPQQTPPKIPAVQPSSGATPAPAASPAKPQDKNSASMDVPLTADAGVSSDIAQLKPTANPAAAAPPSSKLAKPLEESKPTAKVDAKPPVKQEVKEEAKPVQPEVLKKQPAATNTAEKIEKPKVVAKAAKAPEEPRKAKQTRDESDDVVASGFALPIREVHANGRPVSPPKPAEQEPVKIASAEVKASSKVSKATPEVMHVDVGYAVVTNPSSQLPMRVKIGDALPNGAVINALDPVKGVISTNRGSYGIK